MAKKPRSAQDRGFFAIGEARTAHKHFGKKIDREGIMRKFGSFCIMLMLIIFTPSLHAGNVDTQGIGAKATALGGAFSAYGDDPFAVYYNPATLTQIRSAMISLGAHVVKPEMKVSRYAVNGMKAGSSAIGPDWFGDRSHTLIVPHLGFFLPVSDSVTAGVGLYAPYGMDIRWPMTSDNPGVYNSYHSWYRREVISPAAAWKLHDQVSVGLGIALGRSFTGVENWTYFPALPGLHNRFVDTDMEDEGNWSINAGLLIKPLKSLSLGLTYRGRAETKFRGTTQVKGVNEGDDLTGTGSSVYNTCVSSTTEIDSPEQIQGGIRYQPVESLSLEVDLVWTRWSSIKGYTLSFDRKFLDAPALGLYNPGRTEQYYARNWENTTQLRFGVEWKVNDILALRGSWFYDPSPIPDSTFDMQWPDGDKRTYALGIGLNWGTVNLDGVVQYTCTARKREIEGESRNLNESYLGGQGAPKVSLSGDGHLWGAGMTISYRY